MNKRLSIPVLMILLITIIILILNRKGVVDPSDYYTKPTPTPYSEGELPSSELSDAYFDSYISISTDPTKRPSSPEQGTYNTIFEGFTGELENKLVEQNKPDYMRLVNFGPEIVFPESVSETELFIDVVMLDVVGYTRVPIEVYADYAESEEDLRAYEDLITNGYEVNGGYYEYVSQKQTYKNITMNWNGDEFSVLFETDGVDYINYYERDETGKLIRNWRHWIIE